MASSESVFAKIPIDKWLLASDYFFVVFDQYPVSYGHSLIISKELRTDFFELTKSEREDLLRTIDGVKAMLDLTCRPDGYNIGMNCGEVAGQTVMHFHCHVIPRYAGDMANPAGGVRHCVEGKGYY